MAADILSTSRKAHIINEDSHVYGTFAEIGAGQEIARHFFQAGHASRTIAKTMSAYDMTFSDQIYGKAPRYVSRERLLGMLDHEYKLLSERLESKGRRFFVLADTVATSSHKDVMTSHAWLGLRFQTTEGGPANDILVHVHLLDRLRLQQQEVLGILGVNLLYAATYLLDDVRMFVDSLFDNLTEDRIQVDYIGTSGPDLKSFDNRLAGLQLLVQRMANAIIFGPSGEIVQATDFLYGKSVVLLRGTYQPITNTNLEILDHATREAQRHLPKDHQPPLQAILEFTIEDVDDPDEVNYEEYINRIETINACNQCVMVSRFPLFYQLKTYLRRSTNQPLFIVVGAALLEKIFDESYYRKLSGGILKAFGKLFDDGTKLLVFPFKTQSLCQTAKTFKPDSKLSGLYDYLTKNGFIEDILNCDDVDTSIHSAQVREMLRGKNPSWKKLVPPPVCQLIEKKKLFGLN